MRSEAFLLLCGRRADEPPDPDAALGASYSWNPERRAPTHGLFEGLPRDAMVRPEDAAKVLTEVHTVGAPVVLRHIATGLGLTEEQVRVAAGRAPLCRHCLPTSPKLAKWQGELVMARGTCPPSLPQSPLPNPPSPVPPSIIASPGCAAPDAEASSGYRGSPVGWRFMVAQNMVP